MSTRITTRGALAIALGAGLAIAAGCSKEVPRSGGGPAASSTKTPAASTASAQDDAAVIKAQLPMYPLDTCIISGEKLGGMGKAVDYVHEGRLVRFCCSSCIATFKKDPVKYFKIIDEATAKKAAGAPADAPKPDPGK
jgi:hypothetical protein